jgi:hypothetical protein
MHVEFQRSPSHGTGFNIRRENSPLHTVYQIVVSALVTPPTARRLGTRPKLKVAGVSQ